jgi:hypothetical protein
MSEDTPPDGTRWTALVPRWVKVAAPIATVLLSALGGAVGYGIARGETAAELRGHETRIDKAEVRLDALSRVEVHLAELRGEVRQIAARLGIITPAPPSWERTTPKEP